MITDRRKFTTNMIPLRDVSFSFLPLESIQSHSPGLYTPYKKPPQIFCDVCNARFYCYCYWCLTSLNIAKMITWSATSISRRPNFTKFERRSVRRQIKTFLEHKFENFTVHNGSFFQKTQKFLEPLEANNVLCAFHIIQPSRCIVKVNSSELFRNITKLRAIVSEGLCPRFRKFLSKPLKEIGSSITVLLTIRFEDDG